MSKSKDIGELTKALSKLQSKIEDAPKDMQGHGYKYANLEVVLPLIRKHLEANGLSFNQRITSTKESVIIQTMLSHESNQYISSKLEIPVQPNQRQSFAQSMGSAITYGRRYALMALFGITAAEEDNDAAPAQQSRAAPPKETEKTQKEKDVIDHQIQAHCVAIGELIVTGANKDIREYWKSILRDVQRQVWPKLCKEWQDIITASVKEEHKKEEYLNV